MIVIEPSQYMSSQTNI